MAEDKKKNQSENRVLLEEETEAYSLRLEVTPDEMEALLTLKPLAGAAGLSPDELLRKMKQAGIVAGIEQDAVLAACGHANQGKPQDWVVAALGSEPEPGPDGWVDFLVRISSDEIALEEDEFGVVDLRNLNFFGNVEPGQPIVRIHPPQHGEAGQNVLGLPIPPVLGEPAVLVAGEGVAVQEGGALLVAEKTGRVVREGGTVLVTEEYRVDGDVDFHVGSVDFSGFVEITGDVLDEFDIRGEKGIRIEGSVGACRLESEGNIQIGSMAGKGEGGIRCGGNLMAKYLNDVKVECAGNVIVANEIRNSTVKSAGFVLVENGALSGGECISLAGIEARDLGSTLGAATRVTAGVYFPEVDRLNFLHERLKSLQEQISRIQGALGPLHKRQSAGQELGGAILKRIDILSARLEELSEEKKEYDQEVENFRKQEHPTANPKINVRNLLGERVTICLGAVREETRLEMSGPISIIENTREGGLHFLSLSPLAQPADLAEGELRRREAEEKKPKSSGATSGKR